MQMIYREGFNDGVHGDGSISLLLALLKRLENFQMFFLKTFLLSSVFSGIAATSLFCFAAEAVTFTSSTIDIGMVVQDLEKSVSFCRAHSRRHASGSLSFTTGSSRLEKLSELTPKDFSPRVWVDR